MSLRLQLLAIAVLTLVLPWTAFRYVQEMEGALRGGLEQSLVATATTVAASLKDETLPICAEGCAGNGAAATIYAEPLRAEPSVDAAREDWLQPAEAPIELAGGHRLWAGVYGRFVYLFVDVRDRDVVYQPGPGQMPYGDRLVLVTEPEPGVRHWLLLATGAPGAFRAQETAPDAFAPSEAYDGRVLGSWQETAHGYSVEVRVPLVLVGAALGVGVVEVDRGSGVYGELAATWDKATNAPGRLVYQTPELQTLLERFAGAGGRVRILDADGWVLADAGRVDPRRTDAAPASFVGRLLRVGLRRDDPPYPAEQPAGRIAAPAARRALAGEATTAWYESGPDREAIVAAAVPLAGAAGPAGAVLLEQASDPIRTLSDRALVRLISLTVLASVLVALGLLGYATWLTARVRRLAQAAETALGPRGEIRTGIPGAQAADELGDLARSFTHLLERLREHTDYLRTLASKLSHELRTPLAVVTTSLDNLEHEQVAPAAEAYLARLRQGAGRLDAILAAMSEATQLEQAIEGTQAERFDLGAVVTACCEAYRDVYEDRTFACRVEARNAAIVGSGELMAQLLDKLADNAASFSAPGSTIEVALGESAGELVLSVTNRGPLLPAKMRRELFDSLVSIRDKRDGRPHLGLGLHVVALIAKFHGGRVEADDLPDGSGVVFSVLLPKATAR
ncbi:MAG TPA: ATP-binding protein [Gammaproteobacteria bacterium]|nr:ATP-binding protein [Gammaproteobacteria bacterium]